MEEDTKQIIVFAVTIAILALGIIFIVQRHTEKMAALGYEEVEGYGVGTLWQKKITPPEAPR